MYIKQVIIQGFRSYRDQIVIDPFSPRHNVVVGRNGSGKSNFFLAIQFVLNDEFTHMRQEDRQQLLHEGTGPRVVSAYVEIIFDNSDSRMLVDKEEVSLRRVIGSKKDQYFIDKKNVTKTEVMNLLESAGFSRSNPYYIVKQGRIMQLAVAKDHERLKLLREVAGTRVYDERKEESKAILKETESKREKIEELLRDIEERLATLDSEKEELKEYQTWDKERRCLEYTIHDKELRETREKLDEIESSRQTGSERSNELLREAQDAADRALDIGNGIKEVTDQINVVNLEKSQLMDERQEQIKVRTKLELDVKDLEESVQEDAKSKERIHKELRKLERLVEQKQEELDRILPEYTNQKNIEETCQARLKACEQRRSDLYAKQGRNTEFSSKEERDRWIRRELKVVDASIATKEHRMKVLKEEVENARARIKQIDEEVAERNDNLDERKAQMEKAAKDFSEINKVRDELQNRRKDLWRQESALEQTIMTIREDLNRAERNLRQTMSRAVANGIESVKRIVQEKGVKGVYGPLMENFTCDSKFFTAIEVTGGNKLFNIIVDSDKTGTQVLQILNKMKLPGEVTFMPLNRLHFSDLQYPQSQDVIPMISKVEYDEMFKPAMQLAFAKTLICRNMEIASQYSKSANLDCITLEGDQVSRRGALTGGYYDSRKSRLEQQKSIWVLQAKLEAQEKQLAEIKKESETLDGQITGTLNDLEKFKTKKEQLKGAFEKQKSDTRGLTTEKAGLEKGLKPKLNLLANLEPELAREKESSKSMHDELGTELLSQLTYEDQREVERLNDEIIELQGRLKNAFQQRTQIERRKQNLENTLNDNLLRKEEELKQNLEEVTLEDRRLQYDAKSAELDSYNKTLQRTTARITELETSLDKLNKKMKQLHATQEEWKTVERNKRDSLQEDAKAMERMANKKSILSKKKEECMKKIRELGSLPSDAFEKYQRTGTKTLWKKLDHCNEQLKKYSHVNKKALDQFISFSEQNEKLTKRKEELDVGYQAILDAMDVLEQRKHEAILFTFKQVSRFFTEIFKQLVPGGKATLLIKKEEAEPPDDSESHVSSQRSVSDVTSEASQRSFRPIDDFSGISIKVSFTGKNAETYEMNQLSGGQKTLVALTLIFAIQKCDPAPFYLFDEIDQALDPQYRKAVADMIHKLSDNAQFITTTFRPELLESADQFYGVQFKSKVSHILSISKEQAKDFVEDDAVEK